MKSTLKKIVRKLRNLISTNQFIEKPYDFDKSNPLGGGGERVDIQLNKKIEYEKMDMYQKNHFRRYEYALKEIKDNDVCGDFACGTGYGSILISHKAQSVIGADLDGKVIDEIKKRYSKNTKVNFINQNILHLDFTEYFDTIISFETIEHFAERDIYALLSIFNKALKQGGKLIFSTPYNQEKTEDAIKLGFHLTFNILEETIQNWLENAGFEIEKLKYQNYESHDVFDELEKKEFIICIARKIK